MLSQRDGPLETQGLLHDSLIFAIPPAIKVHFGTMIVIHPNHPIIIIANDDRVRVIIIILVHLNHPIIIIANDDRVRAIIIIIFLVHPGHHHQLPKDDVVTLMIFVPIVIIISFPIDRIVTLMIFAAIAIIASDRIVTQIKNFCCHPSSSSASPSIITFILVLFPPANK